MGQHMLTRDRVPAPERVDRRKQQLGVEQRLGQGRQERQQPGVLQHSAADRVDHGHRPAAGGLEQTRDTELRAGTHLQRVAPAAVDAPQDDVHRLEPTERAQPHPALAHREVGALDERITEQRGQERLVERRLAVRPRSQQDDPRRVRLLWRHGLQSDPQGLEERREAQHPRRAVEVGHHARDDAAVLHREAKS